MRIRTKPFRIGSNDRLKLSERPTNVKPLYASKDDYQKKSTDRIDELSALQDLFYANQRYSLLVIFQAMDAAGKDGAIKHVMSGVNPQGCNVMSFKHPSAVELSHDFLWRTTQQLPERGMIGIFNRSYYEEVLIARVHPKILEAQNLPHKLAHHKNVWRDRFRSITDLESHLDRNGTKILKIFLHLSKGEQKMRFLERIDHAEKNWKLGIADVEERKYWSAYQKAYEACIEHTTSHDAPWYVVPADDKHNARLIVSEIILDALRALKMKPPAPTKEQREALALIRETLK
jgi:PPK2 family polyphosphate:nucleotide phosphotransferase